MYRACTASCTACMQSWSAWDVVQRMHMAWCWPHSRGDADASPGRSRVITALASLDLLWASSPAECRAACETGMQRVKMALFRCASRDSACRIVLSVMQQRTSCKACLVLMAVPMDAQVVGIAYLFQAWHAHRCLMRPVLCMATL